MGTSSLLFLDIWIENLVDQRRDQKDSSDTTYSQTFKSRYWSQNQ